MPMAKVVMYRTRFCPYCVRAGFVLRSKHVAFEEVDVGKDEELGRWLREATGRSTVPQIFINDVPIGGCDDLVALNRSGKLDELLAVPHEAPVA